MQLEAFLISSSTKINIKTQRPVTMLATTVIIGLMAGDPQEMSTRTLRQPYLRVANECHYFKA